VSTDPVQEGFPLILVVDDDKSMRMLLRVALEQEGYQVLEAQNGQACLAAYQNYQPDAILLDAVMPVMDGFTCCAQLRIFPNSEHTPVLMLTVLDDPDAVERAFAVGATDYITKPIQWAVLRHRLRRLIQQSRIYQHLEAANRELERLAGLVARYERTNLQ
jgi:PleD family two-component response regulator